MDPALSDVIARLVELSAAVLEHETADVRAAIESLTNAQKWDLRRAAERVCRMVPKNQQGQ